VYFLIAFLATAVVERPDLAAVFAEQGTPGTFVLYDVSAGRAIGRSLLARVGVLP
jgi:hypothetical protein